VAPASNGAGAHRKHEGVPQEFHLSGFARIVFVVLWFFSPRRWDF
jgi:hypothetical protein